MNILFIILTRTKAPGFGVHKETNNLKSKPNEDPDKYKDTFKLNLRIL